MPKSKSTTEERIIYHTKQIVSAVSLEGMEAPKVLETIRRVLRMYDLEIKVVGLDNPHLYIKKTDI